MARKATKTDVIDKSDNPPKKTEAEIDAFIGSVFQESIGKAVHIQIAASGIAMDMLIDIVNQYASDGAEHKTGITLDCVSFLLGRCLTECPDDILDEVMERFAYVTRRTIPHFRTEIAIRQASEEGVVGRA